MAYLTPQEINTHLYDEVVAEISRDDLTKLQIAINAAIAEAKGYLKQYDADTIFAANVDDRNPILLLYVKDIAVWHFIVISNPAVEWQARKDRYDLAIKWLEKVQAGKTNPDLPLPPDPVDEAGNAQSAENFLKWGGNKKRNSHF